MRRFAAALLAAAAVLAFAPAAFAAGSAAKKHDQLELPTETSPLVPEVFEVDRLDALPKGFLITARRAMQIANEDPDIDALLTRHPGLRPRANLSRLALEPGTFWHWDIDYSSGGVRLAEVEIGPNGTVYEVTTGVDAGWPLLHGYPGVLGGILNRPYLWLPLCLLFVAPFFDPRRPLRLLHLDLLVMVAFGVSHFYFNRGDPGISVPLVYPVLAYVVVRLLVAAFRPRRRAGPLVPVLKTPALVTLLAVVLALRVAFSIFSSQTLDVSFAGVVGADRIEHGQELYTDNNDHPDTYGPVNYLAYIPFEAVFPFNAKSEELPAAKAATLAFDFLVMLALFLLGRRLSRDGPGTRIGLALALGWAAYPYTSLVIASNTNDAIVPLFILYALLAATSPATRGALAALGTMAKFAPALVAPALAAGTNRLRARDAIVFGVVFAAIAAAVLVPVLPDGGIREFWNATLGFQLGRVSPLSIWNRDPSLDWLQTLLKVVLLAVAVLAAFWPRRRSIPRLAALCGAILGLSQMTANYWIYFYAVWLLPFVLLALAGEHGDERPRRTPGESAALPGMP